MLLKKKSLNLTKTGTTGADLTEYATNVDEVISLVKVNTIEEWKDNPRRNDAASAKLAEILKVHGQITPIVVCRKTKVVYKGNTTRKAIALLQKNWTVRGEKQNKAFFDQVRRGEVKALFADFPSERAAKAYGIADNKSSEYASWDEDLLLKMFEGDELGTGETGFSETEKNFLMMTPDAERIQRINGAPVAIKDKIVVMIVDSTSRKEIIELLEDWVKATGLKNIEVKK